uniref:Uncharacterized protein n=1 Tax=Cacopsylla melanoneura TaxID=428564 RepID=A0A8D8ZMN9_9HEMI
MKSRLISWIMKSSGNSTPLQGQRSADCSNPASVASKNTSSTLWALTSTTMNNSRASLSPQSPAATAGRCARLESIRTMELTYSHQDISSRAALSWPALKETSPTPTSLQENVGFSSSKLIKPSGRDGRTRTSTHLFNGTSGPNQWTTSSWTT